MTRCAFLVTDSLASYDTRTFLLTTCLLERKMTCEVGGALFRILTIHSPGSVVSNVLWCLSASTGLKSERRIL
jgi:hypothetical protein